MSIRRCCLSLLLALSLGPVLISRSPVAADTPSTQYLLFQIFLGGPDPANGVFHRGAQKNLMLAIAQQIAKAVRPERNDPNRVLGFSIGPIAMDEGEDEARAVIRDAFDIALATNMAVSLHLDDFMFWGQARFANGRLLRDQPGVTEWKDWTAAPAGPLEIGWLPNVKLAPQMCYESPAAREFVTYWTRDVIGHEVKKQFDRLAQAGKAKLFAGVVTGWESNLTLGYCSLSNLGYSAKKPPADFEHERERILHRHIERWAKGVYDAGIPKDLIFTHIATLPQPDYDRMKASGQLSNVDSTSLRAYWTAFNPYSNAGFTGYPTEARFREAIDAVKRFGRGSWAMTEGTDVRPGLPWETYLAWMFNHDAKMAIIFGGFQGQHYGEFGRATESPDAIAAYRKFLRGERLIESVRP